MQNNLPQEPEEDLPGREVAIILAVFVEGGLAPLSLLLGWIVSHPPLATFVWNTNAALWGAVAALPPILLVVALLNWPIGPFARIRTFCDEELIPLLDQSYWSELALISISAGVGEELLFRGVLQVWLGDTLGRIWGLVLAALIFGALHALSSVYVVIAFIMGLYLGAVQILSGNLLTAIVTHFLYDFAVLGYIIKIRAAPADLPQDDAEY